MPGPAGPPFLPRTRLRDIALEACQEHVGATLEGEYFVEALEPNLAWDAVLLRHVFDQPMVVWRALAGFEVLLDDRDRPVGFVDEDKWLPCAWTELPSDEAVALARATGFVPAELPLASAARGESDCLELLFAAAGKPGAVRARLNPARKAVISVVPEPEVRP
jgi:hypothetical protein